MSAKLTNEQQQILRTDRNLMVLAGAGTGKTNALTQRVLSLLTKESIRPGECLVLTFTNKAASEIRERIYNELLLTSLKEPENRHLQYALNSFDEMEINTFHGFFAGVLRKMGYLINVAHDFNILEESAEQKPVFKQLMNRLLLEWSQHHPQETEQLFSYFSTSGLEKLTQAILDNRPQLEKALHYYREHHIFDGTSINSSAFLDRFRMDLTPLAQALNDQFKPVLHQFNANVQAASGTSSTLKKWKTHINEVDRFLSTTPGDKPETWRHIFGLLQSEKLLKKDGTFTTQYVKDKELKSEIADLNSILHDLEAHMHLQGKGLFPLLEFDASTFMKSGYFEAFELILNWTHNILARYDQWKEEKNYLDFNDLELKIQELFQKNPQISDQLKKSFRFIMIDEFQDTNFTQWDIVSSLFMEDSKIMPGKLCLVGDKKQAIYRFRGGEVEVCDFAEKLIEESNHNDRTGVIPFTINFRSAPPLLEFLNTFARFIFPAAQHVTHFDPAYIPLKPFSDHSAQEPAPIYNTLINSQNDDGTKISNQQLMELEAEAIAEFLSSVRQEKWEQVARFASLSTATEAQTHWQWLADSMTKRLKSVGILLRRRSNMPVIESALLRADLPFKMESDSGFFNQPEIIYILNFLSVMNDTGDDASLIGFLRSPLWGASDLFITFLTLGGHPGLSLMARLKRLFGECREFSFPADDAASFIQLSELPNGVHHYLAESGKTEADLTSFDKLTFPLSDWQSLVAFFPHLHALQKLFHSEPLETAFHQFISRFRIPQLLLGFSDAAQRLANLRKFIEFMAEFSATADGGQLHHFLQACNNMAKQDLLGSGELDDDAIIQVMTVHKAKGLEFPLVILPDLASPEERSIFSRKQKVLLTDKLLPEDETHALFHMPGLQLSARQGSRAECPLVLLRSTKVLNEEYFWPFEHYMHQKESHKEYAEERRLLYVALTRAEKALWILNRVQDPWKRSDEAPTNSPRNWNTLLLHLYHEIHFENDEAVVKRAREFENVWWHQFTLHANTLPGDMSRSETGPLQARFIEVSGMQQTPVILPSDLAPEKHTHSSAVETGFTLPPDEFGTLVHQIMEMGYSESSLAEILEVQYPMLSASDHSEILRHVKNGRSMLKQLNRAKGRIIHELPFVFPSPLPNMQGEFKGIIDWILLNEAHKTCIICDFKTNMVEKPDKKYATRHGYDRQLAVYSTAAYKINGYRTETAHLLFTHTGTVISYTADELQEIYTELGNQ